MKTLKLQNEQEISRQMELSDFYVRCVVKCITCVRSLSRERSFCDFNYQFKYFPVAVVATSGVGNIVERADIISPGDN